MSGWIKIHRSITNHWLYTEKRVFSKFEAWNDILLTVNFTDAKTIIKGNLYEVKRGQSILSLDSWSKRWNWDKSKVRRFLNALQLDDMVVIKSDSVTTQLTVCNYDSYQGERNADETQMKRKRNADETQTTPIEERKKEKNEKELILDSWINYRKSAKKPLTKQSIDSILVKMENYTNQECKFVINNSIEQGWQGLFWDKIQTIQEKNEPNKWKAPWS